MIGQTIRLVGPSQRATAHRLVDVAPQGAVVNIREASRTLDQNAKFHAMLSDVSRAKPEGRKMTPDRWKAVFMQACSHEVAFEIGLDGKPFPVGFSSSRLTVAQMADLITFILEYGDRHDVAWSEPGEDRQAA